MITDYLKYVFEIADIFFIFRFSFSPILNAQQNIDVLSSGKFMNYLILNFFTSFQNLLKIASFVCQIEGRTEVSLGSISSLMSIYLIEGLTVDDYTAVDQENKPNVFREIDHIERNIYSLNPYLRNRTTEVIRPLFHHCCHLSLFPLNISLMF